jgi:hypothetical protein
MANFNKDELFCKKCLIHDHFFVGGVVGLQISVLSVKGLIVFRIKI